MISPVWAICITISIHFLKYHVLIACQGFTFVIIDLSLNRTTTLPARWYSLHFTNEKTEIHRWSVTCSRPCSWEIVERASIWTQVGVALKLVYPLPAWEPPTNWRGGAFTSSRVHFGHPKFFSFLHTTSNLLNLVPWNIALPHGLFKAPWISLVHRSSEALLHSKSITAYAVDIGTYSGIRQLCCRYPHFTDEELRPLRERLNTFPRWHCR